MAKVVINGCHGGFGLSHEGVLRIAEMKGLTLYPEQDERFAALGMVTYWTVPENERPEEAGKQWHEWTLEQRKAHNEAHDKATFQPRDIARDDPDLVKLVETMGEPANSKYAALRVVEIPDDVEWQIEEYDGLEWVAEKHRTWS